MKSFDELKIFNNGREVGNNNNKDNTKKEKKIEIITPVASNPRDKEYKEEMISVRKESKRIEDINKKSKEDSLPSQTGLSEIGKLDIENFRQKKTYGEDSMTEEEKNEEEEYKNRKEKTTENNKRNKEEESKEEAEKDSDEKETEEGFKNILDASRRKFVSKHLESENKSNIFENLEIEDVKIEYTKALQNYRKDALEKSKEKLKKQNLTQEEYNEQLRKEVERILTETVVGESNKIYDLKTDIRLEKEGGSKIEEIKKVILKIHKRYRKLGWNKLLISAGLFGASMAVGTAAGATGTAIVTGILFGKFTQRALGGLAITIGMEASIKKRQEKKEVKEMLSGFGLGMVRLLEEGDSRLDEKISKLVGKKNTQKWKRFAAAGTSGLIVGSGVIGYAIEHTFGFGQELSEHLKNPHNLGINDLHTTEVSNHLTGAHIPNAESMTSIPSEITVKPGNSLWKISEEYLNKQGDLSGLDGPQKTYVIDALKDKLAAGMSNPNMIHPGEHIGFGDKFSMNDIKDMIGKARQLTSEQLANIGNYHVGGLNNSDVSNLHTGEITNNLTGVHTYTGTPLPNAESFNIQSLHEEVINLFNGTGTEETVKNIFPGIFHGNEGTIIDRKDGVKVIKDAFKKGYDILISPNGKIGVDGPIGWNWGSKGSFLGLGSGRVPLEKINPTSISEAKKFIIESAKAIAKQNSGNMDYR